ncbi:MAG: SoxXA-binding protein [Gammaproteobacteria bacterium]|nr:SoxXA-binding protein [Gammaproteobacteria bacterium]
MNMKKLTAMLCLGAIIAIAGQSAIAAEKKAAPKAETVDKAAATSTENSGDKAAAESAIAAAESARKKAASIDGEWRDTGKMIKKAQAALKAGDSAKAIKLAKKAENQGKLGYEQAQAQQTLKMPSYLKY